MIDSLLFHFMFIIFLGIASQWVAWRFKLPAIVLMSIAGLIVGPFLGFVNPKEEFGDLFKPLVSMAVAIILFEGSLNLDYQEVRGLGKPVVRIITLGAFIAWILGSLAAHFVAGLSWAVAFVIGGLFIVTGPTVILPLLRQARLKPRPAAILKWEGIIVDPFGALLAVFSFEFIKFLVLAEVKLEALLWFFLASLLAVILGWACGRGTGWMLQKGHVPEFLKFPVVFTVVLACFAIADELKHETGLLAVTAMGITLANMHISSINDLRHFKENISLLLISTIFIMLTASLTMETLLEILNFRIIAFVVLMLFIVRPLSIWISTVKTDLSKQEKTLVGWIAPRGIVALTVSSYFAAVLLEEGFEDASILTSLTFALVFATVVAHGFSISWLAKKLGLAIDQPPGVLIVGGDSFSTQLGKAFLELETPVLIADSSFQRLSSVRNAGIPYFRGEVLSEQTKYHLEWTPYEYMIAATKLDSYNALVCTTFIPEFGRNNLFQLNIRSKQEADVDDLYHTIGGQYLFKEGVTWEELNKRVEDGDVIKKTTITSEYTYENYVTESHEKTLFLFIKKPSGKLQFYTNEEDPKAEPGDIIASLTRPK
ncbi:cation:proton antiporter [Metabacillus arenae]|uniref:Sodium:proton antiporter n=1 Tax=Metabacillus arenae TaxID=2771434 RepID=A0A926N933_9BACI|nr:sodium:proton antiporter [Metabacillus arenae]MBD1379762.1 sodium:proton antiporter [Metabacillus arenae]